MENITLIVNGNQTAQISCKPEDKESVTKVLRQLGIYSSFHGYNFQFMSSNNQ